MGLHLRRREGVGERELHLGRGKLQLVGGNPTVPNQTLNTVRAHITDLLVYT